MRSHLHCLLALLAFFSSSGIARGEDKVREIFVPYKDLDVILNNQPQRVYITRDEYLELLAKAKKTPSRDAPRAAAIVSAEYVGTVEEGRGRMTGTLLVDVLNDGLHAVTLDLARVGVRSAMLDGKSAPLGKNDKGRPVLFVSGRGRHRLALELVMPLATTAAEQILTFQVPVAGAATLRLTVPGNVTIKSGAQVVAREVDEEAGVTRFELLANRGPTELSMTLNNRLLRRQRVVMARSVVVDELTQGYERLHVTASMEVLHGATDHFAFAVPEGFEVTSVTSPLLSRWEVKAEAGENTLEVSLREPTVETVVLNISAVRSDPRIDAWTLPKLKPRDVMGEVAVVGLLVEERLRPKSIESDGLIPIDTQVLVDTLPASIFQSAPGAPTIRPVAAYYAPQAAFELSAGLEKEPARMRTVTNLLLILDESGAQVRGGFALTPEAEKHFALDFSVPPQWRVVEVTADDGSPLAYDEYEAADAAARIHVRLPQGVPPGKRYNVYFHALHTPPEWLGDWKQTTLDFPVFAAIGAAQDSGAIAVQARDDIQVRPETLTELTPLDENNKSAYGLADVPTNLAYRYERHPFAAKLVAERTEPRLTARTYSFLRIDPDHVAAHYEVVYEVAEAQSRELALLLPKDTPAEVLIRGLDGLAIKQYRGEDAGDHRRWNITLEKATLGKLRLAIDFQQPLEAEGTDKLALPLVRADGVAYQSGIVAVEGNAELDVQILAGHPRKVDVGELVDAAYQPGRRLLGVFEFVGASAAVNISVKRHPGYAVPTAIVERAELVTLAGTGGVSQTAARFHLRTKASYLEVQLPDGSTLWSTYLDGSPTKPRREGKSLLLSLPATGQAALRDLQIIYETPIASMRFWGRVDVPAPQLFLHGEGKSRVELPVADLNWHLALPSGYRLVRSYGTVYTDALERRRPSTNELRDWLPAGGARESARHREDRNMLGVGVNSDADVRGPLYMEDDVGFRRSELEPPAAAPEDTPASARPSPPPAKAKASYWALEGLGSLKIDLERSGGEILFESLGADPRLAVTLVDERRADWLTWGVALGIGLVGVSMTRRSARTKAKFVIAVLLITLLVPAVTGWGRELGDTLDVAWLVGCLLIAFYLAAGLASWFISHVRRPAAAVPVAVLLVVAVYGAPASADPPPAPVHVPADALIVPYDPDDAAGIENAKKLMVPYDVYVKLWNAANPIQKIQEIDRPPAAYALAGAVYRATLVGDRDLLVTGELDIDVYAEGMVSIALPLEGGVLAEARLDGAPARLEVVQRAEPPNVSQQATQVRNVALNAAPAPAPPIVLYISDKGRHHFRLSMRFALERRGGWRIVAGRLPAAPATALKLTVPNAETETRLPGRVDLSSYQTEADDETIETALEADGAFRIEWRPKIAEAVVDRSLTAESSAVLDVQEDGLRVTWQLGLEFRRGQRDRFTVVLPHDYLVEKVTGDNVRGWETDQGDDSQRLEITLLQSARDRESLAIHMSRRVALAQDGPHEIEAPVVTMEGAALHHGQLAIRRSPLLDLRIVDAAGVSRTDLDGPAENPAAAAAGVDESPLGLRSYQAYRFVTTPYTIRLAVASAPAKTSAEVQTVLKVAERERSVESRVKLSAEGKPVYQVQLEVPDDLELKEVLAPGSFDWAATRQNGRRLLTVYLHTGQQDEFSIVLRGTLGKWGPVESFSLPKIAVVDVVRQEGDIVVQADPALEVRALELEGCERALLSRVSSWLSDAQRSAARLALRYRTPDYGGRIRVTARTPRAGCLVVSNVRVTDRALEETILLTYTIRDAGIRGLSFRLPRSMRDARISVPMLRQKTIEPDGEDQVRIKLELQDEVMGELRVLVENDRVLPPGGYIVPIPVVDDVETVRRYVALESAGRDELVVDEQTGLQPLSRQESQWRVLADMLGPAITYAYLVEEGASPPRLALHTKDRKLVETAGARIGLGETLLVLDAAGAYRGRQTYRVDNATEQFLDVELPKGAKLWTARVAGQAVKPTEIPGAASPEQVRIPLVKTAAGDRDFEVVLKYGGRMPELGRWDHVSFPLMRTLNINVELSQVRLRLPETHRWFDFGGSMRQVREEDTFLAGFLAYKTKQIMFQCANLQSANPYARVRAESNLRELLAEMDESGEVRSGNEQWEKEYATNVEAQRHAQELLRREDEQRGEQQVAAKDNRKQLNDLYRQQSAEQSKNVVDKLGGNFDQPVYDPKPEERAAGGRFNDEWLKGKKLKTLADERKAPAGKRLSQGRQSGTEAPGKPDASQAPQVAQGKVKEELQQQGQAAGESLSGRAKAADSSEDRLRRYEEQVERQAVVPGGVPKFTADLDIPSQTEIWTRHTFGEEEIRKPLLQGAGALDKTQTAAGLASLDVELPERGVEYLFTTPRGEIDVTGRAIDREQVGRLKTLGWVLAVALVWVALIRPISRRGKAAQATSGDAM